MGLPWVRLDSDIANHDKVVRLLKQRDGYRAFTVYVCALGWTGGQGKDGHVPSHVLDRLYGLPRHAELLVDMDLWGYDEGGDGWRIKNYETRQELAVVAETKRLAKQLAARKGNCVRHHGDGCGCWQESA